MVVARNINTFEDGTIFKSRIIDTCYTVADCYICEIVTTFGSLLSNACYAVADGYACEAIAIFEITCFEACYAIANSYTCETGATAESTFPILVTLSGMIILVRLAQL